ncbi:MAG: hypothetical protein JKY65_20950, partial [Planctomycetes bacterium]|nr:hypothetical protein [Planctomycetota bacterium]
ARGEAGAKLGLLDATNLAEAELTNEALRGRLGLSESVAKELTTFRNAMDVVDAMEKAGVPEAKILEMIDRSGGLDLMTAEATVESLQKRTGLTRKMAGRVIDFRNANEINGETELKRAGLTAAEATRVNGLGLNLATADAAALEAAGVSAKDAKKIVNFRDAHNLGKGTQSWETYNASKAAKTLVEAGVLTEAKAELIARHTTKASLESAKAEVLTDRFGLNAELAETMINFRDKHTLDREGLLKAGLSEAAADKLLADSAKLDAKAATLEAMAERTGLTVEALTEVLRADGLDLTKASEADLSRRLGISAEEAKKLVEARTAGNSLNSVEKLVEAGLSEASAKKAFASAKGINVGTATLEELRAFGMTEADAKRIVDMRAKAEAAPPLDYTEIARQVRFKTKSWVKANTLSEALLRSLLPRPNPAETSVTSAVEGEGTGFSRTRGKATGPFVASKMSYATISELFAGIKDGAKGRLETRLTEARAANDAESVRTIEAGVESLKGLKLQIVESNAISAEIQGKTVRLSTGLFNEVYARGTKLAPAERAAFRMRVLGLIMGHEAAHSSGVKVERVADVEAVRIVEASVLGVAGRVRPAEIKATLDTFEKPLGSSYIDNFFNRVRNLFRYGTFKGRRTNLERAARGEIDALAKFRRADGTLRWKELTRSKALSEGLGLAHFGMALFLKEVATVTATGDKARIEEFFDGLMTTDFYKEYGLFIAGARIGEVAYVKYLSRYIKPTFVNGLMKTNLTLAAGLALPMIVEGTFEGKTYAISLGSLGLSSAAVQGGVKGIRWVMSLKKARSTGLLAKVGLQGGRLARFGGWFYTAAELAVVLYFAEKIEQNVNAYLDTKAAREVLGKAGAAFVDAVNDPKASAASVQAAGEAYHMAWIDYRDFLYGPLQVDEIQLAERLRGLARRAKIEADKRKAAVERIATRPALKRRMESRFGSLERYADYLLGEAEGEIGEKVNTFVDSYNMNRKKHLDEVYFSNRRSEPFMADLENRDWLLNGAQAGAKGDPWGGRTDRWATLGRERAKSGLADELGGASKNRLQAYGDEGSVYASMAAILRDRGQDELAAELDKRRLLNEALAKADEALIKGDGLIGETKRKGIAEALRDGLKDEAPNKD